MPLSIKYKCVFINIPRPGGTSFRKILGIDGDGVETTDWSKASLEQVNGKGLLSISNRQSTLPSHTIPRVLHKEHMCMKHIAQLNVVPRSFFDEYLKFAFVRNPWDKALSVYTNHYHIYCNNFENYIDKLQIIVKFLNDNFTFDLETPFYENYSRITFNVLHNKDLDYPFNPWSGEEVIIDPQFFPQHLFTHDENGNQLIDVVGRFENFAQDAKQILEWLNISDPIEKIHSSDHPPYREAYTPRMKDIIADVYAKDIEMFGYEF